MTLSLANPLMTLQRVSTEIILPSQFFASPAAQQPEHRLMLAILRNAFDTLARRPRNRKYRQRCVKEQREAYDWIVDDDVMYCFSFPNICHALGLDPTATRMAFLRHYALGGHHDTSAVLRVWKSKNDHA